jgi:pseudouridylate synthase
MQRLQTLGTSSPPDVRIAPRVADALVAGSPVVALETTLVTHGFPPDEGLAVAVEIEAAVAASGAEPATIGLVDGRIEVGLGRDQLGELAVRGRAVKLNPSNLAAHLTPGCWGSTTVAATMCVARLTGITVCATGGIGGVHRDVPATGDVSADLTAFARFPVAVVCAGAKAVLDLPRTLEMLETLHVPVFGFGTSEFPAFYSRKSGLPVDGRFDTVDALARAVRSHMGLGIGTGILVANPVEPQYELPRAVWEPALDEALADASRRGIRGRALTPFLLDRLRLLTEGATVFSNRALILNNARLAGLLAAAVQRSGAHPVRRTRAGSRRRKGL